MLHKSPPMVAGVIALGLLLGCFILRDFAIIETKGSYLIINTVGRDCIVFFFQVHSGDVLVSEGFCGGGPFVKNCLD